MRAIRLLLIALFILAAGCSVYAEKIFSGNAGIHLQFNPSSPVITDSQLEVRVIANLGSVKAQNGASPVLTGFSFPVGFDSAYVRLVSAEPGQASGYSGASFAYTNPAVANGRGFVTIMNLRNDNQNPGLQVELARLTFELKKPGNAKFIAGSSRTIYRGAFAAVPSDTGTPTESLSWTDSTYSLDLQPGQTIPHLLSPSWISVPDMFQGMVYMNDGTTDASFQVFGRDSHGSLHHTSSSENPSPLIPLPALHQYARLTNEIFNSPVSMDIDDGWIETTVNTPYLSGYFFQGYTSSDGLIRQLDGAQTVDVPTSRMIFPLVAPDPNRAAEVILNNPGDSPVDLTMRLIASNGQQALSVEAQVPAHGAFLREITETNVYADIEVSNGQLTGAERFGTRDALAMLNGHDLALASNRLVAPQFASGYLAEDLRITTHIALVNPSTEASTVTLRLLNETGAAIAPPAVRTLQAGAMLSSQGWDLFGLENPLTTSHAVIGTVAVESDQGLVGALMFGDPVNGRFLASLPLMSTAAAKREIVFGHTAVGRLGLIDYFTGLALVNTSQTATAHIHLEYHNSNGELIAQTTTPFTLGPNCRTAQLVDQLIPDFPNPQSGGFIRLISDVEVYGYMLFGDNYYNFISAVP
jgi:hypothetical protein